MEEFKSAPDVTNTLTQDCNPIWKEALELMRRDESVSMGENSLDYMTFLCKVV